MDGLKVTKIREDKIGRESIYGGQVNAFEAIDYTVEIVFVGNQEVRHSCSCDPQNELKQCSHRTRFRQTVFEHRARSRAFTNDVMAHPKQPW